MSGPSRIRLSGHTDLIPPDLNPPEYAPLSPKPAEPKSAWETDGCDYSPEAACPDGAPEEHEEPPMREDTADGNVVLNHDVIQESIKEAKRMMKESDKFHERQAGLKKFLAAAMDAVHFLLITSSMSQQRLTKDEEDLDDSLDEEDEPPVKQLTRAELLIMNGTLSDPPWRFSMSTYSKHPDLLEYYTGFRNYDLLQSIFELVKPSTDTLITWLSLAEDKKQVHSKAFKSGVIPLIDEFFLFLLTLAQNLSIEDLSIRFSLPPTLVEQILTDWTHYLFTVFGQDPIWPSRGNVDDYMPRCFRDVCPCVRAVLHFTKLKIKCPEGYVSDTSDDESDTESANHCPTKQHQTTEKQPETEARQKDIKMPQKVPQRRRSFRRATKATLTAKNSTLSKLHEHEDTPPLERKAEPVVKEANKNNEKQGEPQRNTRVVADREGYKHFKSLLVFQPTGAVCIASKLYPQDMPNEDVLEGTKCLKYLEECDDLVSLGEDDDFQTEVIEEMLHPHGANYMNLKFMTGCASLAEFRLKSPIKAHRIDCMIWHVTHSVEWLLKRKVWNDDAELPAFWVKDIDQLWTISCLLTNFLPADRCIS